MSVRVLPLPSHCRRVYSSIRGYTRDVVVVDNHHFRPRGYGHVFGIHPYVDSLVLVCCLVTHNLLYVNNDISV